jgi:hypothetical protein
LVTLEPAAMIACSNSITSSVASPNERIGEWSLLYNIKWLHVRLNNKDAYLNVNLMTALNYKTWIVQTLKLN